MSDRFIPAKFFGINILRNFACAACASNDNHKNQYSYEISDTNTHNSSAAAVGRIGAE
jgi:hypothetical protein